MNLLMKFRHAEAEQSKEAAESVLGQKNTYAAVFFYIYPALFIHILVSFLSFD